MEQSTIAQRFSAFMQEKNISRTALAKRINIPLEAISRMTHNKQAIKPYHTLALQAAYGVSAEWLLHGTGDMMLGQGEVTTLTVANNVPQRSIEDVMYEVKGGRTDIQDLRSGHRNMEAGHRNMEAGQRNIDKGQRNMEAGLINMDKSQRNMEAGLINMDKSQRNMEAGLINIDKGFRNLEARIDERMGVIDIRLVKVENKLDKTEGRVMVLEGKFEKYESK